MPSSITLRVLDGADRGRVYETLNPPVTIGREEGNTIQLNDERISRFHLKIQEDNERLVLTDLESTNGTKVNGEDIQLRILRFGDMVSLGRSVLLFGSREQIAERLARLREADDQGDPTIRPNGKSLGKDVSSFDFELNWDDGNDLQATLHALEPPDLPDRLSPGQAAQLAEVLEYLHIRLRSLLNSVNSDDKTEQLQVETREWQNLLDLQCRIAEYLRQIGDPDLSST
ncbi:MAG: FHA domain-containing protein [Planctomycetota bacterium]|nr:FHA domain-containing protein [Planctomycetota bacterium]